PSPALPPCGPAGAAFDDHAWVPADTPAVASIRLDDPTLASALDALGEHTRAPGHGLPIPLALSLGQWSWQVPLLVSTLRAAGFAPAELTFVASADGAHAWIWRNTCDLDPTLAHVEEAWSVELRRTVDAVVGTPAPAADAPAFPHDVLILPGDRMALVPAGRGSSVLARLSRPAPAPRLGAGATQTAGQRLDALEPAPVRLVVQGLALVDPAAATAPADAQALRITAEGIDGASVGDPS
ncbi:MAG: hypothetical protein KDK70_36385, partial [Myxococcales bacterium]|nr:hypothetical protein [Myxococcales bacterium]